MGLVLLYGQANALLPSCIRLDSSLSPVLYPITVSRSTPSGICRRFVPLPFIPIAVSHLPPPPHYPAQSHPYGEAGSSSTRRDVAGVCTAGVTAGKHTGGGQPAGLDTAGAHPAAPADRRCMPLRCDAGGGGGEVERGAAGVAEEADGGKCVACEVSVAEYAIQRATERRRQRGD